MTAPTEPATHSRTSSDHRVKYVQLYFSAKSQVVNMCSHALVIFIIFFLIIGSLT